MKKLINFEYIKNCYKPIQRRASFIEHDQSCKRCHGPHSHDLTIAHELASRCVGAHPTQADGTR